MGYRGSSRGEPSAQLPPTAFIAFLQNHDQVGNRAFGDRLESVAAPEALRAATALYLLLPQIPMLFMGEEWGARSPFPFFCDFDGELGVAVSAGRRREFARFAAFSDPDARARIPDPNDPLTFSAAKLDWKASQLPAGRSRGAHYQALLAARAEHIVPLLPLIRHGGASTVHASGVVEIRWKAGTLGHLRLLANLTAHAVAMPLRDAGQLLWREGGCGPAGLDAWAVQWSLECED
jgi:maltooligosyltrehalose trehalohydrolase